MRKHSARNAVAAIVAGIILAVTVAPPAMAEDSAAPAAQLSVTLTSTQKTVTAGDKITYTGRLQNLGASDTDVTIDMDAPAYVKLGKSTGAKVDKSDAKWTATLAPGKTKTFVIKASIGKIPSSERRVTTVASVYVGDAKAPIVRTADASFIKGVDDTPGAQPTSTPSASSTSAATSVLPWIIAGGILILLLAAAAVILVVRRNRRRQQRSSILVDD
jgi:hypothetical protein